MKIDSIDVYHVAMPMKAPWRTAFGEEHAIDSIIVRMTGPGVVGWGESAPYRAPNFSPEWAAGGFALIRDWLAPALIGLEITDSEDLQGRLRTFKGNPFAKGALDCAWWDARAKSMDTPLWRLIGGHAQTVPVGADIPVQTSQGELIEAVRHAVEAGFGRVKLKFRRTVPIKAVAGVREAFPSMPMHIDCNCGFTLDDAPLFEELDQLELAMIEQPLAYDDLIDHARLQERLQTPICLDESIPSPERARKAIAIGACGSINIKVGRVGGLTGALTTRQLCVDHGMDYWIGGMLESALGQGPSMALASLDIGRYPSDIFPSSRLYSQDLSEPEIVLADPPSVRIPDVAGCGFTPNPDRLAACTIAHERITTR